MIGFDRYTDYASACQLLNIETLHQRREAALRKLAGDMLASTVHPLYPAGQVAGEGRPLRRRRKFVVPRARTERYRKSPIPVLIGIMNSM